MRIRRLFGLFVLSGAILASFQNCSKAMRAMEDSEASLFKATEECMGSTADACLFDKNAVAQTGNSATSERLSSYQTLPVTLSGLDNSGWLQNSDIVVTTSSTTRLSRNTNMRQYYSPSNSHVEQLMAYHYTRRLSEWMQTRGLFPASGQGIKVIVDSSFNAWVPGAKEIHLERNGLNFPAALDGSLVVSLYAQANIWAASGGQSQTGLASKAAGCADSRAFPSPYGCCTSANGCGSAVISGAADFMTAVMFPRNTVLGDGWKNDAGGLKICGMPRDAAAYGGLTAAAASNQCASRGASAQANALGLVYASIWWEARKQAADTADFERFFLRHLSQIRGDDDFSTMKNKILTLDTNEFAGRYGTLMSAEFSRRGL